MKNITYTLIFLIVLGCDKKEVEPNTSYKVVAIDTTITEIDTVTVTPPTKIWLFESILNDSLTFKIMKIVL